MSETIPRFVARRAATVGHLPAMRVRTPRGWEEYSWRTYADQSARAGMALLGVGVRCGDRVAVISQNRPEWCFMDVGGQGVGAVVTGVHPQSPAAEVRQQLADSGTVLVLVDSMEQLRKVVSVRTELPRLRWLVVLDDCPAPMEARDGVLSYREFIQQAPEDAPAQWERHLDERAAHEPAVLIYTSGTTGTPKGAVVSHANLVYAADAVANAVRLEPGDSTLCYLPLCHSFERFVSVAFGAVRGHVIHFGRGMPHLAADIQEVEPHVFAGVPRVWQKMAARTPVQAGPADAIRSDLGFSRLRHGLSSAAPLSAEIARHFQGLGIPLLETYAQTESGGPISCTSLGELRPGTVGRPIPGMDVKIADDGEIHIRCDGIFLGYLQGDDVTPAIGRDGWLATGDIGQFDESGCLVLHGRKGDTLITARGAKIAPALLESRLKAVPWVAEAVVVGDGRDYLSALVCLDPDAGLDDTEALRLIRSHVAEVNANFRSDMQLRAVTVLRSPFSALQGELTMTQKVRRNTVHRRYEPQIAAMYEQAPGQWRSGGEPHACFH